MENELVAEENDSEVSTRELLRLARKKAYQDQKARRKAEKIQKKAAAEKKRVDEREKKDAELWNLIRPANKSSS